MNCFASAPRRFTPRATTLFPLGEDKLVDQRELYMALTDFDRRKEIAQVTEPFLLEAQAIRDALGTNKLSCNAPPTLS